MRPFFSALMIILSCVFCVPSVSWAQATQETTPVEEVKGAPQEAAAREDVINPAQIPSVVFSYWEHTAIKDARRSRGNVRAPTQAELVRDLNLQEDIRQKPPPEARDIRLGGIVYVSGKEWAIWLNGKRVTPDALPAEAIDLFVYKDYIELKWFDEWTNKIYPIRLRPHERFNMDTRIFLPG